MPIAFSDENSADGNHEIAAAWVVRRSLLYHYYIQDTSGKSYSLFILVAAQKHVKDCLVDFFSRTAGSVGGEDPFNAHLALHHHCLGRWPIYVDQISKELRKDVSPSP